MDSPVVPNDGDALMGALVAAAGKNCETVLHASGNRILSMRGERTNFDGGLVGPTHGTRSAAFY